MPLGSRDLRFDSGSIYRWEFKRRGSAETFNANDPLALKDRSLMVDAAIDDIGVAFVSDHLVTGR